MNNTKVSTGSELAIIELRRLFPALKIEQAPLYCGAKTLARIKTLANNGEFDSEDMEEALAHSEQGQTGVNTLIRWFEKAGGNWGIIEQVYTVWSDYDPERKLSFNLLHDLAQK